MMSGRGQSLSARTCDVVVVGASAGGIEALRMMVRGLPADLAAAVLVVLHIPRSGPRALAAILERAGPLKVTQAEDGEAVVPGRIYVAASDHHLLLDDGHVRLSQEPAVNGHRPSVDVLFRSASRSFGSRVIAVVLSGAGDDGAAGLSDAVRAGAFAIVQDPTQAGYSSMPERARARAPSAMIRRAEEIGPLIGELVAAATPGGVVRPRPAGGPGIAGPKAALTDALRLAIRALEERSAVHRRMASGRRGRDEDIAERYDEMVMENDRAIHTLQDHLASLMEPPMPEPFSAEPDTVGSERPTEVGTAAWYVPD